MWARVAEFGLGAWLATSPIVWEHPLWLHDVVCGAMVVLLAALSFTRRLRRAHLGTVVVALWLVAFGYAATRDEATAASQNHIIVGLLLLMFAIVPAEASQPPPSWRRRWGTR